MRIIGWMALTLLILLPLNVGAATYEEFSELRMERSYAQKLQAAGRYNEALDQAQRVLQMSRKLFGGQHRETAMSLDGIGSILRKMGKYGQSEQYFQQALQITRQQRQEQPYDYAAALQNLAGLYRETGRYRESEQHYLEAISVLNGLQPRDEEAVVSVSGNLAILYENQGRYAEAEPLLKAEYEWALKTARPDKLEQRMHISKDRELLYLADRMSSLGGLYLKMKRNRDAVELTATALEIKQKILKGDDPRLARELNNMGMIYSLLGRYQEAGPLLVQAVNSARKIYGNRHPELAVYLDNLAMNFQRKEQYGKAEPLYLEAIDISASLLGAQHSNTLSQRNNLAVNYLMQNRFPEAEKLLRRIVDDSKGGQNIAEHPELAARLGNLAEAVLMQGNYHEGFLLQEQAIRIKERTRDDLFLLLTEQQKLQYVRDEMLVVRQHLSLAGTLSAKNPETAAKSLDVWLRWKGIVMESQGRYLEALYRSHDPLVARKLESLAEVRRELAGLRLVQPTAQSVQNHLARIDLLEHRKDELEGELGKDGAAYARESLSRKFGIEALRRLLPSGTAYLDIALVEDWSFVPYQVRGMRYLAFIVSNANSPVQLVDLGPADRLDQLIQEYRRKIAAKANNRAGKDTEIDALGTALYGTIMGPLQQYLAGVSSLLISPDGALHLLPFEVLRAPDQRYLIEHYAVSYIGSGRDVARFGRKRSGTGGATLFADPDYDLQLTSAGGPELRGDLPDQLASVHFDRLPDTRVEADAVAGLLGKTMPVTNLVGQAAVESTLFHRQQPRILHLATHGFFLHGAEQSQQGTRGLAAVQKHQAVLSHDNRLLNPMVRSGIVLAGVNRSLARGRDDGLVTAEKILGLSLLGTELVTLSACETGVGDVRAGEGVFGLKRAFILAGARSVILSLWSVPSRETTELMIEFYRRLSSGITKATALRQAQLALLKKYPNPFYWGAFQLVGSPE